MMYITFRNAYDPVIVIYDAYMTYVYDMYKMYIWNIKRK